MNASTPKATVIRLLRLVVSGGVRSSSGETSALGELETELALLREENARLKVERHRPPDAGRIIERMRHLEQASHLERRDEEGSQASEAGQAVPEYLAIREGLLEACHEIQQAMQGIRSQLGGLSPDIQRSAGDRVMSSPIVAPPPEEVDLGLAVGARAPSGLSQSAV